MPILMRDAAKDFEGIQDGNIIVENVFTIALTMGGIYLLFAIIKGFFLFLTRQTIIINSRFMEYDLKNEIYNHYQKLNYNFYRKNNTGDLMNRISEDVSKVRMYLGPGIMYTINLVVLFVMCLTAMLYLSPKMTLYTLIPLPVMSVLIYLVSNRMNRLSEKVQREQSNISTITQETFSGIRVLKAYSAENAYATDFNDSSKNYFNKSMKLVVTNALFMPTILLLIGLSTIITIYVGGIAYYAGEIDKETILPFIIYVNMLTWPFASVGWVTSLIQRAAASQERINEFLHEEPQIVNPSEEEFDFKGEIEFKDVSYKYENSGIQAIENLSFKINKGETLAIIGRTGSGKSSIVNLIMRQFDPNSGDILIDGKALDSINIDEFRNQSGVVPQEVFLFSDTIGNNISFGVEDGQTSKEEMENVAKQAHVLHNIKEFKDGFETLLGERGVNLSGGQKQRISIARALIRKPKLLVLDDCLSAVDTETEEIILSNLKNKLEQNTSIIVSHRVSSIRNADKIIVIDEGKMIEQGTHDALMDAKGSYYELYLKQLAEEEDSSELGELS